VKYEPSHCRGTSKEDSIQKENRYLSRTI
jgi:hypothetical protein